MPSQRCYPGYSKDQAAQEISRAKKISRAKQAYMKQARLIVKKLENMEMPGKGEIDNLNKRLIIDEKSLAKMLKPATRLEKSSSKKRGHRCY